MEGHVENPTYTIKKSISQKTKAEKLFRFGGKCYERTVLGQIGKI